MTLAPLLIALGALQAPNPCDAPRSAYPPCVGVPVVLWFCGPIATGPLTYAIAVDGIQQPATGTLVRYGYNVYGQHLEAPNDVSQGGQVQYITPGTVTMQTPGAHTVTVTYGSGQVASMPMIGATTVTSVTEFGPDGKPLVTACPAVARQ